MKHLAIFVLFAGICSPAVAQTVAIDSISGKPDLIGPVNRSAFQDSSWFTQNYTLYIPTSGLISRIDSLGKEDSVVVVFGSWCSDSHMWVPMFLRIADSTILGGRISFIAVPRSSGWRDELTPGLNIEKVPTFIFYKKGVDIGRLVEEPDGDLGENIVKILRSGK